MFALRQESEEVDYGRGYERASTSIERNLNGGKTIMETTTLETSKRIWELSNWGEDGIGLHDWCYVVRGEKLTNETFGGLFHRSSTDSWNFAAPQYTLAYLLGKLPATIQADGVYGDSSFGLWKGSSGYTCGYMNEEEFARLPDKTEEPDEDGDYDDFEVEFFGDTATEVIGKLVIALFEAGVLVKESK